MRMRIGGVAIVVTCVMTDAVARVIAQAPTAATTQQPTFRQQITAVTLDVVARDEQGQFIADLSQDEFEIYEDGVKQALTSMTVSLGGRIKDVTPAAPLQPAPAAEGIILPASRQAAVEAPGRIFLFLIDDLHLQAETTLRLRALFNQIADTLVHPGDMFAVVSTGPSAIEVSYSYDVNRLRDAIRRMVGHGLAPNDVIQAGQGTRGVEELRHRAQVVLQTVNTALTELANVQNRRKAIVWVSEGYDFTPFQESRLGQGDPNGFFQQNLRNFQRSNTVLEDGTHQQVIDSMVESQRQAELFSDADLSTTLQRLTAAANRVNATIYTIDPRGLVASQQIDQQVNPTEWATSLSKSLDTMRGLAARTGGLAIVEENDFSRGLKRIDADASDYYILAYSSSRTDATSGKHRIEVRVTRPGVTVRSRSEYFVSTGKR